MWWWRRVRRANIPADVRQACEMFGPAVLSVAIAGHITSMSDGHDFYIFFRNNRAEILEWLREQREIQERRENRRETVEWAIMIFAASGVLTDLLMILR